MSLRGVLQRGYQRGIQFLKIIKTKKNLEIRPYAPNEILIKTLRPQPWAKTSLSFLNNVWKIWLQSCRETWAAHLRRQACMNFMVRGYNGQRGFSLLAFVGVAMVSNSGVGIITNHDEMKAICEKIRKRMVQISMQEKCLQNFEIGHAIAKGCNAVVYSAKMSKMAPTIHKVNETDGHGCEKMKVEGNFSEYPLAVKMMFNYDAESYAPVILRAMYRETLPAKSIMLNEDSSVWDVQRFKSKLTSHPNIVDMKYVFADRIPVLPEQLSLYPHALPSRLFPEGCGRNMTLFLVMKRYHKTLREFLKAQHPSPHNSLMILAQILEGVHFLNQKSICHRDLKSDNILLDLSEGPSMPKVVITDFGCCTTKMFVSFPSFELDQREGNVAMMAPEVSTASPGPFTYIDYRKADLWAVGALAYEIYGNENPFYTSKKLGKKLDSRVYKEENLPPLSDDAIHVIKSLVFNLLSRKPSKVTLCADAVLFTDQDFDVNNQPGIELRMSASVAADICHILLSAPCDLLVYPKEKLSAVAVTKWIVLEAASICSVPNYKVLDEMKVTFLRRVKLDEVMEATTYIRSFY
ncbi:Serine/threonine-protein kinase PINK1, mitochondrial [Nymphon striatum]|nr:Serine/threonine-protein kinase PINK1, mitochondrial [Nymphon striatum]